MKEVVQEEVGEAKSGSAVCRIQLPLCNGGGGCVCFFFISPTSGDAVQLQSVQHVSCSNLVHSGPFQERVWNGRTVSASTSTSQSSGLVAVPVLPV